MLGSFRGSQRRQCDWRDAFETEEALAEEQTDLPILQKIFSVPVSLVWRVERAEKESGKGRRLNPRLPILEWNTTAKIFVVDISEESREHFPLCLAPPTPFAITPLFLPTRHDVFFFVNQQMEAQIVLGDRPVEVTLQRAWEALSLGERFDLGRVLLGLAFQRAGMGGGGGEGGSNAAEEVYRGGGAWTFSRRVGYTGTVCSALVVWRRCLVMCGEPVWASRWM